MRQPAPIRPVGENVTYYAALAAAVRTLHAVEGVVAELELYRSAAKCDATMEGPRFKGWDRSALDRARKVTDAALRRLTGEAGG